MGFKDTLKECLSKAGMTQKSLVEELKKTFNLDVGVTGFNYYVRNNIIPKPDILDAIVKILRGRGLGITLMTLNRPDSDMNGKVDKIITKVLSYISERGLSKQDVVKKTGATFLNYDVYNDDIQELDRLQLYKVAKFLDVDPGFFFKSGTPTKPIQRPEKDSCCTLPVVARAPKGFNIEFHDNGIEELRVPVEYLGGGDRTEVFLVKVTKLSSFEHNSLKIDSSDYLVCKELADVAFEDLIILKDPETSQIILKRYLNHLGKPSLLPSPSSGDGRRPGGEVINVTIGMVDFRGKLPESQQEPKSLNPPYIYVGKVISLIRFFSGNLSTRGARLDCDA